jgi:hypothetical protein
MSGLFSGEKDFHALSLKDLLEARDFYHVHLTNKENVVATAVGRYLIRKRDPWPERGKGLEWVMPPQKDIREKPKRTLFNSEVRPYSWPCILVFVDKWLLENEFGIGTNKKSLQEMIPKTLYLPDGRKVPVCVVEVPEPGMGDVAVTDLIFPKQRIMGGGYPVLTKVQGQEYFASIGCLVTDGHLIYALTNRHVSGAPGERLYTLLAGEETEIGKSSAKQLTKVPFGEVYPGWPGEDVFVNLDIGLVELLDKDMWTTQVYGIGKVDELADFSTHNLSLKLVGQPVRAYGCASRLMLGEIRALFYRYKALNGYEYIADFLIGSRQSSGKDLPFATCHGDSGTLWLLEYEETPSEEISKKEKAAKLLPLAVQWGGQVFGRQSFALATCLSTVCRHLDVEVVRDWNTGFVEYWGAVGHYGIAAVAIEHMQNQNLRNLMESNRFRITYKFSDIKDKTLKELKLSKADFVPLADVPDYVWAFGKSLRKGSDPNNHFADVDVKGPKGKTLLQQFEEDPDGTMKADVWIEYYDYVNEHVAANWPRKEKEPPVKEGLLPFRVGQIFKKMVEYAENGQKDQFVCAAGILSHYIGDACNPFHISCFHHGDPEDTIKNGEGNRKQKAYDIHGDYEAKMLAYHGQDILQGVMARLASGVPSGGAIQNGKDAAKATMQLMLETYRDLNPIDLVKKVYNDVIDEKPKKRAEVLWDATQGKTVEVITRGCLLWTKLCDSAWEVGGGDVNIRDFGAVNEEVLSGFYSQKDFLPSLPLEKIKAEL